MKSNYGCSLNMELVKTVDYFLSDKTRRRGMIRINVGIDLAITSQHVATVYDPQIKEYLGKPFKFDISFKGYEWFLAHCKQLYSHYDDAEIEVSFIMEPTSLVWMPLCCYLIAKGFKVYRVTTQKSSDFRKFISKYNKSDKIDANSLARLPEIIPDKIYEVYMPSTDLGVLGRKTKYLAKLINEITMHKNRIISIFEMTNPKVLDAFGKKKFTETSQIFFRHYSNPLNICLIEKEEFFNQFGQTLKRQINEKCLEKIYETTLSTLSIYKATIENNALPFDFEAEDYIIQTELDLIDFIEQKKEALEKEIEVLYRKIDNFQELRSIQGIGERNAPLIMGLTGDIGRFKNVAGYKKSCGYCSKKSQSANTDIKGLPIDKAAQSCLKAALYMAAETARLYDVEFAALYNRLTSRGLHHIAAVSACANKMAGRVYAVLKRMKNSRSNYGGCSNDYYSQQEVKYKFKNQDNNIITKEEARKIILEKYPSKAKQKEMASLQLHNGSKQPFRNDSSLRSCKTHQAKYILKDILPESFFQGISKEKADFIESLNNLQKEIKQKRPVNKMCTDGGKNVKKR